MPLHAIALLFMLNGISSSPSLGGLQPFMPNVCVERQRVIKVEKQPCVKTFIQMVKVWKQACPGQGWCVSYERRTTYYTGYRHIYTQDPQPSFRCCPGWTQLGGDTGCLHMPANKREEQVFLVDPPRGYGSMEKTERILGLIQH